MQKPKVPAVGGQDQSQDPSSQDPAQDPYQDPYQDSSQDPSGHPLVPSDAADAPPADRPGDAPADIPPEKAAGPPMSAAYIVETRDRDAGILVRDGSGYRFFSAGREFNCLDGRLFATPRAAAAAATACLTANRRRTRD